MVGTVEKKYNNNSRDYTITMSKLLIETPYKDYVYLQEGKIVCKLCLKDNLDNSKRSIGSHFGFHHKDIVATLCKKTVFTIKCLECNKLVANSQNVLGRHVRKEHKIPFDEYEIKWFYKGVRPKCKTCDTPLKRRKGGFYTFCSIKCGAIGTNNSMWGKKGKNNPNKGKIRTQEHREKYRKAACKRYEENPDLIKQRQKEAIARLERGEFCRNGSFVTTNPITKKQERFDSKWEHQFVLDHIDEYSDLTKTHKVRIPYLSSTDGREHIYIPDFVSNDKKEIIEIKGRFKEKTADKIAAARDWCKKRGYKYRVFTCGAGKTLFEVDVSGLLYGDTDPISYGSTKMLRWRDKNLSSKLVASMPIEEKEEVAKAVFNFYRTNGFPYIVHDKETLIKEWKKLLKENINSKTENDKIFLPNKKITGNKLVQHFNSNQFYTVRGNGGKEPSMVEAFNDNETLMKVIRNRLNITFKETFNIHGAMLRQGFRSTRSCAAVSTFNCLVAKYIYTELAPENGIVFDYSAGFGHRMLGALASPNNLKYIACDPWKEAVEGSEKMAAFLNQKHRIEIWNCGSEKYNPPANLKGKVNLAFSSPPYYNKEVYDNGNDGQAYNNRNFKNFIKEWWIPTLKTVDLLLEKNGKLVINMVEPMINHLLEEIKKFGWVIEKIYYLELSRSHFDKTIKLGEKRKSLLKTEPIVVLKKDK